jgi:excisionase family DNA binding protein
MAESIRALATVTLDAQALEELGPEAIDKLADLVEARLVERRAAGLEPLLTVAAAAELAGVHPGTIRTAIRDGAMDVAGYIGKRPRMRRAAVEAWVSAGRPSRAEVRRAGRVVGRRGRSSRRRVLGEALADLRLSSEDAA